MNRAEVSFTPDAAGKHLLIYGYFHPRHLEEMNLSTGHLIPVTTDQPPVHDGLYRKCGYRTIGSAWTAKPVQLYFIVSPRLPGTWRQRRGGGPDD
jgi:hypothetical protein